jgi:hypothetical protein
LLLGFNLHHMCVINIGCIVINVFCKDIQFFFPCFSGTPFAIVSTIKAMEASATRITTVNRIVQTVGKHITAQHTVASSNQTVRVDESTQFGIVVSRGQIVEFCLLVEHVSPVAQGIVSTESGSRAFVGFQQSAPSVVKVLQLP